MRRLINFISLFVLVTVSCRHPASPVESEFVEPSLAAITYKQIDYNQYSVQHSSGPQLMSKDIVAISVGEVDSSGFHVRDSSHMSFDPINNTYVTDFNAAIAFDLSRLDLTVRVRYYRVLGTYVDYDTTLSALEYPYPSSQILYFTLPFTPRDIDISDSVTYSPGDNYLYMIDLRTGAKTNTLVHAYTVLTIVDNRYVYYDHVDFPLYRYDLVTQTMNQVVYLPRGREMLGLEYHDSTLYSLLWDNPYVSLLRYSLSGEVLDSVRMSRQVFRLSILDGIAYCYDWERPQHIYQFDLSTRTFIGEFKAPADFSYGIRIRDGYVYYVDAHRWAVMRFPLHELFSYGRIESVPSG